MTFDVSPGYLVDCATRDDEVAEWFFTHPDFGPSFIFSLVDGQKVYIESTPFDIMPFRWEPYPNAWCVRRPLKPEATMT